MNYQIGKTIRILRSARELKLNELAKSAEISVPFLSLIENGERQASLKVLRRIAKELKVPSEVLILMSLEADSTIISQDPKTKLIASSLEKLIKIEKQLKIILEGSSDEPQKDNTSDNS